MRLDLILKHSGLIKRRTVAKFYCERGLVLVNDKVGKPSTEVKNEDVLIITMGKKILHVKVNIIIDGKKIHLSYELLKTEINDKYDA